MDISPRKGMQPSHSLPVMCDVKETRPYSNSVDIDSDERMASSSDAVGINIKRQESKDGSDVPWQRRTFTDGMENEMRLEYQEKVITHAAPARMGYVPNLGPLFSHTTISEGESTAFQGIRQRRFSKKLSSMANLVTAGESQSLRSSMSTDADLDKAMEKIEQMELLNTNSCLRKVMSLMPGPGSIRGGVFNLASATLGAGALTLPQAFATTGVPLGSTLLVFMALVTMYSIRLLIWTADALQGRVPNTSYEDISVYCFGKVFGRVVEVNIILFCFGAAVGYVIAAATYVTPLIFDAVCGDVPNGECNIDGSFDWMFDSANPGSTLYKMVVVVFTITVLFPLSLIDKMNTFRFTSFIGVGSIFYLILAISGDSLNNISSYNTNEILGKNISFNGVMQAIPTIMFAFTCQVNVFSIYQELYNPIPRRMIKVSDRACILSCVLYGLIGAFGFLRFSDLKYDWDTCKGNILSNYQLAPRHHHCSAPNWVANCWDSLKLSQLTGNIPIVIGEVAITITILLAFPLNIFPCRYTLEVMIKSYRQPDGIVEETGQAFDAAGLLEDVTEKSKPAESDSEKGSKSRHFFLTVLIVGMVMLCAVFIPSIQTVFSLLGSTCSAFVCYIVPAMFHLKTSDGVWSDAHRLPAWLLLIGGTIMGVVCTIITIINL